VPILGSPTVPPLDSVTYPPGWTFAPSFVDVGAVRFGQCDSYGVEWHVNLLDGWDDTPNVVSTSAQRVGDHGITIGPQVYAARNLTLNGWLVARTFADRTAALMRLHRSLPVNALATIAVTDPDGLPTRYVQARIGGQLKSARIGECCYVLQIPLEAPDPRKYGLNPDSYDIALPSYAGGVSLPTDLPTALPVRTSGGSKVVENIGDMGSPWTARIVGPAPSPTITAVDLGATFTVDIDLQPGDTLDVDSRHRTVLLNGTASRAALIIRGSAWFELPPQQPVEIAFTCKATPVAPPVLTFTPLSAWS
jgi:hypothetical protein